MQLIIILLIVFNSKEQTSSERMRDVVVRRTIETVLTGMKWITTTETKDKKNEMNNLKRDY